MSSAPRASRRRSRRRAPIRGTISSPCASTQAMASCAAVAPFSAAIAARASTSARFLSRFSPWNRGKYEPARVARRGELVRRRADQPAREHAVGDDRDAQLAEGRQGLGLDVAGEHAVLGLQGRDRVDGVRPPHRRRRHLRDTDVPDVPGLHQLGDRADGLLDRHRRVEPGRLVEVDDNRCPAAAGCSSRSSSRPPAGRRSR